MSAPLRLVQAEAQAQPVDTEPLLTAPQVARILAVRPKRVYELGIPSVRLSARCLRWRRSAVEVWIAERSEGR